MRLTAPKRARGNYRPGGHANRPGSDLNDARAVRASPAFPSKRGVTGQKEQVADTPAQSGTSAYSFYERSFSLETTLGGSYASARITVGQPLVSTPAGRPKIGRPQCLLSNPVEA